MRFVWTDLSWHRLGRESITMGHSFIRLKFVDGIFSQVRGTSLCFGKCLAPAIRACH